MRASYASVPVLGAEIEKEFTARLGASSTFQIKLNFSVICGVVFLLLSLLFFLTKLLVCEHSYVSKAYLEIQSLVSKSFSVGAEWYKMKSRTPGRQILWSKGPVALQLIVRDIIVLLKVTHVYCPFGQVSWLLWRSENQAPCEAHSKSPPPVHFLSYQLSAEAGSLCGKSSGLFGESLPTCRFTQQGLASKVSAEINNSVLFVCFFPVRSSTMCQTRF